MSKTWIQQLISSHGVIGYKIHGLLMKTMANTQTNNSHSRDIARRCGSVHQFDTLTSPIGKSCTQNQKFQLFENHRLIESSPVHIDKQSIHQKTTSMLSGRISMLLSSGVPTEEGLSSFCVWGMLPLL